MSIASRRCASSASTRATSSSFRWISPMDSTVLPTDRPPVMPEEPTCGWSHAWRSFTSGSITRRASSVVSQSSSWARGLSPSSAAAAAAAPRRRAMSDDALHLACCMLYQCFSIGWNRSRVSRRPWWGRSSSCATSARDCRQKSGRSAPARRRVVARGYSRMGSATARAHACLSFSGAAPRNSISPNRSSTPREIGVPVTHHRLTLRSRSAISAAFVALPSTICASSRHTRHHTSRGSGVGTTSYRFRYLSDPRVASPAAGSECRWISDRSTSYVVRTTSCRARSAAETTGGSPPREEAASCCWPR